LLDILIKNAQCVNEGKVFQADIGIKNGKINCINPQINKSANKEIDGEGKLLIPGMIDDQVHFREPGLTQKADIESESRAAAAGGITSYMEMPNTNPQTTTIEALENKFEVAAHSSWVNYSFYLGATNDNIEEIKRLDRRATCGIKIFMGSSTGNMLVDNRNTLETAFREAGTIIATHCEKEEIVQRNLRNYQEKYGDEIPISKHPLIRSREACFASSKEAVDLARATGADLHILHISTAEELDLFSDEADIAKKKITAEACVHHIWFTDEDYKEKGSLIKWNPAIKLESDRAALRHAISNNKIDVLATDHAPHTLEEKNRSYLKSPAGGPMVQHALPAYLEMVKQGHFSIEKMVEKVSHNPAKRFKIKDRGFLREGYWADLVLIDPSSNWNVTKESLLYKCAWSPFEGQNFSHKVEKTFVSGNLVYDQGEFFQKAGKRLEINR
jgi:dihydroorotase